MSPVRYILFIVLFVSFNAFAQRKITIENFDDSKEMSNKDLRRKVRQLQDAVIDLQDRVTQLEAKAGISGGVAPEVSVTCYIETPFDGVFDATGTNETKARIEAVKACMGKVKSRIHCAAEKVRCGR